MPPTTTRQGLTSSNVNLREGPGTNFKTIALLPNRTLVTVLAEADGWYRVTTGQGNGFVNREFVILPTQKIGTGFFIHQPTVKNWPLAPIRQLTAPPAADSRTRQVVRLWNKYGNLLQRLADRLKFEVAAAVAVVAVESSGNGFVNDRLLIRFENHYFWRLWGKDHPENFRAFFSFEESKPWTNHLFRSGPGAAWRASHENQDGEWEAFTKACQLNEQAAKSSISMGLPQIMGANYNLIGYESAGDMFRAFSQDERAQVIGLFDFIQGPESVSRKVIALQNLDFVSFAEQYNGPGQAAQYGGMLRFYYELFRLVNT